VAELLGKKTRRISLKNMKRLNGLLWALHVPRTEAPAGSTAFIRFPFVVSTEKLKSTAGWEPRYDSLETFKITLRARGTLPQEPAVVQPPTTPVA
jgi:hypothetical protein